MKSRLRAVTGACVLAFAAGCGGGPAATHNVKIDVGSAVAYAGDPAELLPGVTVTLLDVDGESRTATTNSSGLWTIENILPGVYTESYQLAGYATQSGTFAVPAGGENNVKNVFITRPTVLLAELNMTAMLSPFSTEIGTGDVRDGIGGVTLVYSSSANASIAVTFSRRVSSGQVRLRDGETGQQVNAAPDGTRTIWTISEAQISTINGGGPNGHLTLDQDPFTWHRLEIAVSSYTPIHGTVQSFQANAYFNAVP